MSLHRSPPRLTPRRRPAHDPLEDPLSGVANLFDASLAFIVALLVVLFGAAGVLDLFNPAVDFTLVKEGPDGEMEIITREAREVRIERVTPQELAGMGVRLGTAFQLEDGRIVYVPESGLEGEGPTP